MTIGDSNEAKIKVAEYSTILFQQGQPRFVLNLKQLYQTFRTFEKFQKSPLDGACI